jgi:hypothetical protein
MTCACCDEHSCHWGGARLIPTLLQVLVCAACFISAANVAAHLRSWSQPKLQVYTVRMLLMVPIYAVEAVHISDLRGSAWVRERLTGGAPSQSILALRAGGHWVVAWETLRETYEAYAIYCFVRFLITGPPPARTCPRSEPLHFPAT